MDLELSQVLLPVQDIERSLHFYETILGLPVALRDGERYAAVRAGGVKLALASPEEREPSAGAAAAFKVGSVDTVAERLRAAGVSVPEPAEGAHERTLEVRDPDGHALLFYEPK